MWTQNGTFCPRRDIIIDPPSTPTPHQEENATKKQTEPCSKKFEDDYLEYTYGDPDCDYDILDKKISDSLDDDYYNFDFDESGFSNKNDASHSLTIVTKDEDTTPNSFATETTSKKGKSEKATTSFSFDATPKTEFENMVHRDDGWPDYNRDEPRYRTKRESPGTGKCSKCQIQHIPHNPYRPEPQAMNKFLGFFLKDNPDTQCPKAGHAAYGQVRIFFRK